MGKVCPRIGLGFVLVFAGCGKKEVDPSTLPSASVTLREVGKRLGKALSPEDLTNLGSDQGRLLRSLTASERMSLGRAYLRFRVDRSVVVEVAVPDNHPPFWLEDSGFVARGRSIDHPDGAFRLWSRRYEAGTVGLGVNSLDRRPLGHYAVFVRGEEGHAVIDRVEPDVFRVVSATQGISPYADDSQSFAQIPADLERAQLVQTRRDWRHSAALIRGKVWKTRLPSGPGADQVVVGFGIDPSRSLTWTWRTDPTITASEVNLLDADGRASRVATGDAIEVESDGLLNDPLILRHRVGITGLEPDTVYRYAIRDGSRAGWTAWKTVRTGPASPRDYAFLYMGDPQCGLEEWGKLLQAARSRRPDAGFLLIAGDLVDRGNERGNWDHFFHRAAGIFDELPLMPCVGNHEYLDKGPAIFSASFKLPDNGPADVPNRLIYSFEYSDSFVAVLDSNPAVYSTEMARRQADWLDEKLAATKARWKFVVFHHPIYASHPTREQPQLAEAWVPIFDKHKVDLVLQGHDHAYLRTYPMRAGRPVDRDATVYVVSVSGQKFVSQAERGYTAKGFTDLATYQTIDISPTRGTLLYRVWDADGREHDRLEIAKPIRSLVADLPVKDPDVRRSEAP
jgi:3',5'-cyclic AMP phosphodiesterase CpdA